ncbi:YggS family pyridoxal phosphate-dependent enzyme [Treponema sp.]|uniref:YggS family pyridoxal phosphate-dependent enzyme n=1 Tax=Treponema sp. TaxID=166 RepID=UPI00298D75FB|nr:YggS family pyridoxal phosphate-dependent enzyme [Treponema sp.]MCR5613926.1 YggS family pyridoxal phosphate-dependent enzyme [Treponema sp.]
MSIKENLEKINSEISETCKSCKRNSTEIKLVAVSKFHPLEKIEEAISAGQLLFGENRVQEAKEKFTQISLKYPNVDLHIIGSLQRNKVKDAVKIASCIESVDRLELLDEIEKQCSKIDKKIDVLLEVHTGEESKSGFLDFTSLEQAVCALAENKYPHVNVRGLMTMAPFTEDESLIRKSFSTTKKYLEDLKSKYPALNLTELSMGMSNDFKIAIEEGSTMIRVGTSIFGAREY